MAPDTSQLARKIRDSRVVANWISEEYTLEELAKMKDLTRERIRQILKFACCESPGERRERVRDEMRTMMRMLRT